jgi:DnaJ-class molecular chaperone
MKGKTQTIPLQVDLEVVYNGKTYTFEMEKTIVCKICSG